MDLITEDEKKIVQAQVEIAVELLNSEFDHCIDNLEDALQDMENTRKEYLKHALKSPLDFYDPSDSVEDVNSVFIERSMNIRHYRNLKVRTLPDLEDFLNEKLQG